jgi:hypothetical protein
MQQHLSFQANIPKSACDLNPAVVDRVIFYTNSTGSMCAFGEETLMHTQVSICIIFMQLIHLRVALRCVNFAQAGQTGIVGQLRPV